jgi:hypothetical protein
MAGAKRSTHRLRWRLWLKPNQLVGVPLLPHSLALLKMFLDFSLPVHIHYAMLQCEPPPILPVVPSLFDYSRYLPSKPSFRSRSEKMLSEIYTISSVSSGALVLEYSSYAILPVFRRNTNKRAIQIYTPPLHVVFGGSYHLLPLYWLIPMAFGVVLLVWASIRVLLMRKSIEQARVQDIKGLRMCEYMFPFIRAAMLSRAVSFLVPTMRTMSMRSRSRA